METERIEYIDTLRGFAIFLVTLGHVLEYSGYPESALHNFIYSFHMPLFICISGFVIAYSFNRKLTRNNNIGLKDVFNFIYKKFLAIMIPYYAWSLIISPLFFYSFDGTLDYTKTLKSVLIDNTSFWFLPCLFGLSVVYIIFKYLQYLVPEKYRTNAFLKTAIMFVLLICLFALYHFTGYDYLRSITNYIIPFIIGVLMSEYKRIYDTICNNHYIYTISLILFCLVVGQFISPISPILEKISRLICGILSLPVCFGLFSNIDIQPKYFGNWLNHIGQHTLIIYIVQFAFLRNLIVISGLNIFMQILIFSVISVTMILLILLISKVFEQNKLLRVLFLGKK